MSPGRRAAPGVFSPDIRGAAGSAEHADGFEFDAASLEELRSLGQRRKFTRGQRLVFEGDRRGSILLIESGSVKIVATTIDGDEIVLAVHGPGQLLGDLSVLTGSGAGAGAIALGEVHATMLLGTRYLEFLEKRPHLMLAQLRRLVTVLRESDMKLTELASVDLNRRVARRLLELLDLGAEATSAGHVLTTQLSQHELAAMCGASREGVARCLRDLREDGIVLTDRRQITIVDRDALIGRS